MERLKQLFLSLMLISVGVMTLLAQDTTLLMVEDWESGDFSTLQWERVGTRSLWEVTSEGAHNGRYCVRSGNYYQDNIASILQLSVYLTEGGMISYFRKIFSAPGGGVFYFYLDGQPMDTLTGYADWAEYQCDVSAGYHVLKFCYNKNTNEKKGSDCVWMDDLTMPAGILLNPPSSPCDAPQGLTAQVAGEDVTLSWSGSYSSQEVTISDDLESYEYGAINTPGTVGWGYIDGDGEPTSSFSSLNFLNEGAAMAYIVLDDELIYGTGNNNAQAHSGHKFFGCPFHYTIHNDDWMVSPELQFTEAFTFSFYARSFSSQFTDEQFVVAYSLTDSNADSFIPLHCEPITTTTTWTEYSFLVPPQAKYVAIHCISFNQYIFCVDDLSIHGNVTTGHTVNVYRDGLLIASDIADSTYTDTAAPLGNHCYTITYNCGVNEEESDPSDTVCVAIGPITDFSGTMTEITTVMDSISGMIGDRLSVREYVPEEILHPTRGVTVDSSHIATTLTAMFDWNKYPSYEVYTQLLQYFQDSFPNLCRIDTVLDTTPHPTLPHSIFAIHISNTLGQATTKPAFLYSSTMHGTEVVGYYLMLYLADYILNNAATDSAVMRILDNVDLYICPLENPDGTYHLSNSMIWQGGGYSTYHNYNDVQLNRNYPHLPGLGTTANIQPETQAIIDYVTPKHFVMSVNYHCGAELLNYPWDSWATSQRPHADADWFRYVCQNYATLCHAQDTSYMYGSGGRAVIEGGDWYAVSGSRQDYMTYYQRCREVTIETSLTHVVTDPMELQAFWTNTKDALLSYVMECDYGFWGVVTDAVTHEPVEAMVRVINHDMFHSEVFSHLPLGAYHRPIMAGTYTVEVSAPCYQTATFTVTTKPGTKVRCDVALQPQVVAPIAFDQYILPRMQTTIVALAEHEVLWYDSDTATSPIATGAYFTTPALFDTTTYYLEEVYQDDTLWCVSPRSSVTVFVIDTSTNAVPDFGNIPVLKAYPNPAGDYLMLDGGDETITEVEIYDVRGRKVLQYREEQLTRLDLSSLTSGTYFLRVFCAGTMFGIAITKY